MKPLSLDIYVKGFRYRQIAREGDVAVYSQSYRTGAPFAYEVIIIGSHGDIEVYGKPVAAAETYPTELHWGAKGWTISGYPDNLAVALAHMRELITQRAAKKARRDESTLDTTGQDD